MNRDFTKAPYLADGVSAMPREGSIALQFRGDEELLTVHLSPTLALDLMQEIGRALAQRGPKLSE